MEKAIRDKWREVPATDRERAFSSELLKLTDDELLKCWHEHDKSTDVPEIRGWYREKYRNLVKEKDVLDFGCGFSVDGIFFLKSGANVTFADIIEDNLTLVKRIVDIHGFKANYYFIDNLYRFNFTRPFDHIFAIGSLIHVPFEMAKREVSSLQNHLKVGGRFMFFGYPHERYVSLNAKDGAEFGKMTDGERTPWAEWYDSTKICELFGSAFELEFSKNFGPTGIDFNWFELTKMR